MVVLGESEKITKAIGIHHLETMNAKNVQHFVLTDVMHAETGHVQTLNNQGIC